jgi:hypothetical protein
MNLTHTDPFIRAHLDAWARLDRAHRSASWPPVGIFQIRILDRLAENRGGLTIPDLADHFRIQPADTKDHLERLAYALHHYAHPSRLRIKRTPEARHGRTGRPAYRYQLTVY